MDSGAVYILLCLMLVQTSCHPHGGRAVLGTVQLIQTALLNALDNLSLNTSCERMNFTEHFGPEPQPLGAHHFTSLRCCVQKASVLVPKLSRLLLPVEQYAVDVVEHMGGQVVDQPCDLPAVGDHFNDYKHAKCLLQFVNKWFNNTTVLPE